ncbi:MAG: ribosome small subunit-dependent GTPase A [Actinomycetota bacterium]
MTTGELDDLARLTPDLASLGWTDDHQAWFDDLEPNDPPLVPARLARVSRGFSLAFTGGDAQLVASGSTRAEMDIAPATGDFVAFRPDDGDRPTLHAIAPRSSALTRRAAGRIPEPQVLAANAETVLVMHGLDRELNERRIERQLVVTWDSGADPVLVFTKADLVADPSAVLATANLLAPGVPVILVSSVDSTGLDAIAQVCGPGATVALLGLSGVGKSTLVNALSDGEVQLTGEVRAADRRGRHTTVTRELIPLPSGGLMLDAPGIREIGLWQAYDGLARAFPEITEAETLCRFANCTHDQEPGCGVRAAIAEGRIDERRLAHWRDLHAELALQEEQLEEYAKRAESRSKADADDVRDGARSNRRARTQGRGRNKRNRRR